MLEIKDKMDQYQKNALEILNKDRGKCVYCGKPLSLFDALMGGDVCDRCVKRNHAKAVGRRR